VLLPCEYYHFHSIMLLLLLLLLQQLLLLLQDKVLGRGLQGGCSAPPAAHAP